MSNHILHIAILGKPQIQYQGELLTADRISLKGQALLVYLAVTGQVHSRPTLAGLLWGDMPEEAARANLRLTLSKLRKFLPETVLQASRLEIGLISDGYWLDVIEFQQGIQTGDERHKLYRGDFLDDFFLPHTSDFDEWAAQQRAHLRQTAIIGLTKLVEKTIQEQAWEKGIAAAHQLLTIEPWHEEGHRHLMHLLALSGQRSAALAQYETCRRLLDEELGVAPQPETQHLYEQIRHNRLSEQRITPQLQREQNETTLQQVLSVQPIPLHNLPTPLTPFIGREKELNRLVERLLRPDYRLLTLLGEGGVGKTRLALAAAAHLKQQFADGVWFVSLVGLEAAASPLDVVALENHLAITIASALDIIFATPEPPKTQLLNYLRGKTCLLVLDNFEPLLAAAGFVLELLLAAPGVTFLITSREPLHLQAEAVLRLTGLSLPKTDDAPDAAAADGIRLFAERVERTTGQEIVTPESMPDVLQLCRFVNGSPLGIELIASLTRWLSLAAIGRGLAENAVQLETKMRDVAPRHRSMQAVFDYSWNLLSQREQHVLAQLAVFRRGFQLEAARAVVGCAPSTLFALVDKSLVQHREDDYYGLHDLLHQYAAAHLAQLPLDRDALYQRHATYYLQLAGQQEAALVGPQPHTALRRMQADSENLTQAWQWAVQVPLPEVLASGLGGMAEYWAYAGLNDGGEQALAAAAAAIQALIDPAATQPPLCRLFARLLAERAWLLFELHRLDEMVEVARTTLHWAGLVGDEALEAQAHLRLGQVQWRHGNFEAARDHFQQAQQHAAATGQTVLEAVIWRNEAAVAWQLGDLDGARESCGHSLSLHQQAGDIRGENRSRHFFSLIALQTQEHETVRSYLEPVAQSAQMLGERRVEMGAYAVLGQSASYQGQYQRALAYFDRERVLVEELNMPWQKGSNASNTGDAYLRLGDYARARASYEQALALFQQLKSENGQSNVLAFMGLLAFLERRYTEGITCCETALQLAQKADVRREQAFAKLFMAHNLAGMARWVEAWQIYTEAQAAWQLLKDQSRNLEAKAGLAQAAWQLGKNPQAVHLVNEIWPYLDAYRVEGADDPVRMYVISYQILARSGDKRAELVRERGRVLIHARAEQIHDPALRQMFLETNPSHTILRNRPSISERS